MVGVSFENPDSFKDIAYGMADTDIERLAEACKVVSSAYRSLPWFRMAFQDSIISALEEVNEVRHSPTHYYVARKVAERIFDAE